MAFSALSELSQMLLHPLSRSTAPFLLFPPFKIAATFPSFCTWCRKIFSGCHPMDILKLVYDNPSSCQIKDNTVVVSGRSHPFSKKLQFSSEVSGEYVLGEVVFFILNSKLSYTEYVERCQREGITPVTYLDQVSIKDEVSSYKVSTIPGHFIRPCYTNNSKYDIPEISPKIYMLLVNDIASRVNMGNIVTLLRDNELIADPSLIDQTESERSFSYKNKDFIVYGNIREAPPCGWQKVSVVFFDVGYNKVQDWLKNHQKIPNDAILVSFQEQGRGITCLSISKRRIQNYGDLEELLEKVNPLTG